jgi:transcriptional regulator with XRE-family HTH domain
MTSAALIRAARLRAGLSQEELGERLRLPRTQIGRWEAGLVEPGFSTLRRVLQACGFDLSPTLVPHERDEEREQRLARIRQLSPQDRLQAMLGQLEEK